MAAPEEAEAPLTPATYDQLRRGTRILLKRCQLCGRDHRIVLDREVRGPGERGWVIAQTEYIPGCYAWMYVAESSVASGRVFVEGQS